MPKTETLNLRVSTEFKKRLMEEAKKDKRSVTNYLEATLAKVWREKELASSKRLTAPEGH
jgi:predicted HicB family RNase H-like nuclease